MIRSMTGFARSEATGPGGQVRWELRSVNHRYLDLQFRLPEGLRSAEAEFRAAVNGMIRRGKVDASLNVESLQSGGASATLDMALARQLVDHAETIAGAISNPAPLDPLNILRWHGVMQEPAPDFESLLPAARQALEQAVAELQAARGREGEKIFDMLDGRCDDILGHVQAVRVRLPQVLAGIRTRLSERIEALTANPDTERLEQELVMLAQKLDVSEELDRLEAHVGEVRSTLAKAELAGRRLDFLMQELNREANTLGSKSADAETTRIAVDLKVVIEQMREQVQNVE